MILTESVKIKENKLFIRNKINEKNSKMKEKQNKVISNIIPKVIIIINLFIRVVPKVNIFKSHYFFLSTKET